MTTPVGALDRSGVVIVPQVIATALIDGVVRESAALSTFTRVPVGTKESIVPVLSKDIEASWVGGDTGLKSADTPKWDGEKLIAEDLAVLVPIPLNLLADQTFNITEAMRPLFTRAMARGIDRAALWGVDKPEGWESPSLLEAATEAGNTVAASGDPVEDLVAAAELPSVQGYLIDRAIVRPGWQFAAARIRARDLVANPAGASDPFPLLIAGLPLYINPPAWDASAAIALTIDSTCCLIGLRQDITVTTHPDGVIIDDAGKVLFNAMQQDSVIYRCVMRVGYLLVKPPTDAGLPADQRAPVAAVVPAAASGNGAAAATVKPKATART